MLLIFNSIVAAGLNIDTYIRDAGAATEALETIQISIHDKRITALIQKAPIDHVFAELAKSINIKVYRDAALTQTVSVSITGVPVQAALHQILAGLNFAVEYNESGRGYPPAAYPGAFTVYIFSDASFMDGGANSQHLATREPSPPNSQNGLAESFKPAWREALNHADPKIRLVAINAIVGHANLENVGLIYPFLNDQSAQVREAAIVGISQLAGRDSIRYLEQLVSDPSTAVRETIYELAADLGDPEAVGILAKGLHDPDPFIQQQAIEALAEIGSRDAVAALHSLWQRGGTSTRKSILLVLPDLSAADSLVLLSLAFNDLDTQIRRNAVYTASELAHSSVDAFIYKAMEDENISVREAAKEAISSYLQ